MSWINVLLASLPVSDGASVCVGLDGTECRDWW